jgi:hypothetical protein
MATEIIPNETASVMTQMKAVSRGFVLARKTYTGKKDQWQETEPIEASMKKRLGGLLCWSPKAPTQPWVQLYDDLPDDVLPDILSREAKGELELSQVQSEKELWEEYNATVKEAYEADKDGMEGAASPVRYFRAVIDTFCPR